MKADAKDLKPGDQVWVRFAGWLTVKTIVVDFARRTHVAFASGHESTFSPHCKVDKK